METSSVSYSSFNVTRFGHVQVDLLEPIDRLLSRVGVREYDVPLGITALDSCKAEVYEVKIRSWFYDRPLASVEEACLHLECGERFATLREFLSWVSVRPDVTRVGAYTIWGSQCRNIVPVVRDRGVNGDSDVRVGCEHVKEALRIQRIPTVVRCVAQHSVAA